MFRFHQGIFVVAREVQFYFLLSDHNKPESAFELQVQKLTAKLPGSQVFHSTAL